MHFSTSPLFCSDLAYRLPFSLEICFFYTVVRGCENWANTPDDEAGRYFSVEIL